MSLLNDIPLSELHFYLTAPYPCSYLPGLWARSQVAAPDALISTQVYSELAHYGFRRSGAYTYRPHCDGCQACVPLRVPVKQFTTNRTQRRAWVQHAHLQTSLHRLQDKAEYYDLYQRYQCVRHPEGEMDNRESYHSFLLRSHVDSLLVEFREPVDSAQERHLGSSIEFRPDAAQDSHFNTGRQGTLRMVSLIDLINDGLSSVYTFYDPDLPRARFGVYNVLWQIELCRQLKLDFVYLGYWIQHSRKMSYKIAYQPAQILIDGVWQTFDKGSLE